MCCRCQCGNSNISLLVGAREYRCCKEFDEAMWEFTFERLDAGCVASHSDYTPLTNRTVLSQVGPLLKAKSAKQKALQQAWSHRKRVRGRLHGPITWTDYIARFAG